MDNDDPAEELTDEELVRRIDVLKHNIRELRAAARACASEYPDSAEEFEEVALAVEDAQAALADSLHSEEDLSEVYRETLHRLQNVRSAFDADLLAAIDDAVATRLRSWE